MNIRFVIFRFQSIGGHKLKIIHEIIECPLYTKSGKNLSTAAMKNLAMVAHLYRNQHDYEVQMQFIEPV